MQTEHAHPTFGLVAGWGRFPIVVAEALKRQGYRVICLGIKGHADAGTLRRICDEYHEVGMAKLGQALRYFTRNGVTRATMAGKIFKVLLFQRFAWLKHVPDWRFIRSFYPHFVSRTKDRRDDSLLTTVVEEFAQEGIHFAPATDFAPELLVKFGTLSGRLTLAQKKDIEFGWQIAKEMGRLDIGQSIVVKDLAVLAVEAIEGTDECIRRAGLLCPSGGFTVVKVAKPQQDMRFDVPTIGCGTLETMLKAGGRVLAVEAGKTIILDEPEVIEFASRHRLPLVAMEDGRELKAVA